MGHRPSSVCPCPDFCHSNHTSLLFACLSVLFTVSLQQLTLGQRIFLELSANPKLLVPETTRDREWPSHTGSTEREGAESKLGYKKEFEEGLHLRECERKFEEENAVGHGHQSLLQKVCRTIHLSIHLFPRLLLYWALGMIQGGNKGPIFMQMILSVITKS